MLELIVRQPETSARTTPLLFVDGVWHNPFLFRALRPRASSVSLMALSGTDCSVLGADGLTRR